MTVAKTFYRSRGTSVFWHGISTVLGIERRDLPLLVCSWLLNYDDIFGSANIIRSMEYHGYSSVQKHDMTSGAKLYLCNEIFREMPMDAHND